MPGPKATLEAWLFILPFGEYNHEYISAKGSRSKSEARSRFRSFLGASEATLPLAVGVDEKQQRFWGFLGALRAPRNYFVFSAKRTCSGWQRIPCIGP